MGVKPFAILAASVILMVGCSSITSRWREDAHTVVERARQTGADHLLPEEFRSLESTLIDGEQLLVRGEREQADSVFLFAVTKGKLLASDAALKQQQIKEELARQQEAERQKLDRLIALEREARRAEEERARKAREEAALLSTKTKNEKTRQEKERQFSIHHTVKRGETLPLIAAQPDVYNDANLWPLLYRANRDQISDPAHIWPGQVLRIPRTVSRESLLEARRFAREKPLY